MLPELLDTNMIPSKPLILALCAPSLAWASCRAKHCKAFPGTPEWPSDDEWSQFNEAIDGRLIKPELPGGVCHEGQPNYNEGQCAQVAADWLSFEFHAADPVSVMSDNFANNTCLPNAEYPCSAKGYPSYVANVTTAEHVKAAVHFGKHTS